MSWEYKRHNFVTHMNCLYRYDGNVFQCRYLDKDGDKWDGSNVTLESWNNPSRFDQTPRNERGEPLPLNYEYKNALSGFLSRHVMGSRVIEYNFRGEWKVEGKFETAMGDGFWRSSFYDQTILDVNGNPLPKDRYWKEVNGKWRWKLVGGKMRVMSDNGCWMDVVVAPWSTPELLIDWGRTYPIVECDVNFDPLDKRVPYDQVPIGSAFDWGGQIVWKGIGMNHHHGDVPGESGAKSCRWGDFVIPLGPASLTVVDGKYVVNVLSKSGQSKGIGHEDVQSWLLTCKDKEMLGAVLRPVLADPTNASVIPLARAKKLTERDLRPGQVYKFVQDIAEGLQEVFVRGNGGSIDSNGDWTADEDAFWGGKDGVIDTTIDQPVVVLSDAFNPFVADKDKP